MREIDRKYRYLWKIGNWICAFLYFSGINWLYVNVRKKCFKRYRSIVLTYHRVCENRLNIDISVRSSMFGRQMKYLRKRYLLVLLKEVRNKNNEKIKNGKDAVAITFDDGYKDNYLNAFPILKEINAPATIFLVSRFVNNDSEFLNTSEIAEMRKYNINYGSHTSSHKILSEISLETAKQEILSSKIELERLLNENIPFFAYPKGKKQHINDYLKEQVKAAGYEMAFTMENGSVEKNDDIFQLKRIGIRDCPMFVFKTRVSGILESKLANKIRNALKIT
jgi:peptidoglycan/xylan/chitin deacetylase (PgdA/CDA1 family)